ncbi:IclR family transcriptional regulator [Actinomadura sp. 7K534]|nr:IclR family transcriptional regulator [Actinomadura sp. 7K534]
MEGSMTASTDKIRWVDSSSAAQPRKPQYPIESVDNALRILLLLGERKSLRLTEVSEYLSVASSTAHRVLAMLQYRGFVRQSSTSRAYEPGPALTEIAFSVLRQIDVREQVRPLLEELAKHYGETVHLARLDGSLVSFVDAVESSRAVRVGSRMGKTLPAHVSASGKVLLAQLPDEAVVALYPRENLEALTPHSLSTRTALLEDLDRIRKRGYATGLQESEDGVIAVAAPLGTHAGSRYAVSISAPSHRKQDFTEVAVAEDLLRFAEQCRGFFS